MPGLNLPAAGTGILSRPLSLNEPRNLQLTLRLSW